MSSAAADQQSVVVADGEHTGYARTGPGMGFGEVPLPQTVAAAARFAGSPASCWRLNSPTRSSTTSSRGSTR